MPRYLNVMVRQTPTEEEYQKDAWNELVDEHNWYGIIDDSKGFIYSNIKVVKDGVTKPSESDFNAKVKELKDAYASAQYKRNRAKEYPRIKDQLDMLWHAIDAGKLDKTSDFYITNKAVKDKYPKG
tara:strand:- start:86 stop:463 length:378 start_codon:yes stop_codon:yes gene_type:complete